MNVLMSLCRFHEDIEAVDMLASVTGDRGGNNNPSGLGGKSGKTDSNIVNHNIIMVDNENKETKQGTSAAYTMRRLSKDFPLIHERVLSGELSPNKAALEA